MASACTWRPADEILLRRLEDEAVVDALFAFVVATLGARNEGASSAFDGNRVAAPDGGGAEGPRLHPRASGMIAELRKLPGGEAAAAGNVASLSGFIDDLGQGGCSPELLHHLALFHARVATSIERTAPDAAAEAWIRSLAAWLALAEERTYLARLEDAVLGGAARRSRDDVAIPPERVPLELVAELARRAESTARDLAPPGRAALRALARTDEAARLAGVPAATARRVRAEAERRRNGAIEAALAVIAEGLDEANVRGELASSGRTLLLRAIPVWTWTSKDEAVEHFVIERIDRIGWELYRARSWDALRYLLDPFRPMFDSLAARIEREPMQLAYAAGCAQMFVFLAEVEAHLPRKLEMAERAVKVCPTHRNGRLVLASALCHQAMEAMRGMVVFARGPDIERVQALLERAEALYPQTSELPDAKGMLERVKRGRIF